MITKIRGILLIVEFVITILITIVIIYFSKESGHKVRKFWANMQKYIMNFKIIQKGKADKDAKLILMNHQSLVDIIALEAIYPENLCWVAKQELAQIPLFGHIVKAPKMVAIDRKDKRSIIKIIKLTKERIAEGRVMAMFPEGTRTSGDKLLDFQAGAKILAEKLNLKVQPVVIVNSNYILDSKKLTAHSGNVSVVYLDTIDPKEDANWFSKMHDDMQRILDNELANYTSNR